MNPAVQLILFAPSLLSRALALSLNFSDPSLFDPRITFTRASGATRIKSDGTLELVGNDVPRISYDAASGKMGLLIEEARTNLLIQSNDISNAAFSKTNVVATANTTASPSGAMDAALVVDNATSAEHYFQQNCTTATNQTYTQSIFVKAGTSAGFSFMVVSIGASVTTSVITFGQSGGVFTQTSGLVGLITAASVVAVAGGWYRCSVTYTLDGTVTAHLMRIYPKVAGIYVGTGVGAYFWGAQLEAGAFPTSYIPTEASAVTRNADVATMTGANFSDWYNQAEGTFEAIWSRNATLTTANSAGFPRVFEASDGTTNNLIYLSGNASSVNEVAQLTVGGSVITTRTAAVVAANTAANSVFAYKTGFISLAQNGATPSTSTAAFTAPAMTTLYLGNRNGAGRALNGHLRKLSFYKQALTSAEVQAFSK